MVVCVGRILVSAIVFPYAVTKVFLCDAHRGYLYTRELLQSYSSSTVVRTSEKNGNIFNESNFCDGSRRKHTSKIQIEAPPQPDLLTTYELVVHTI